MLGPFGYLGANFGKRQQKATPAQQYLREKTALMAAEKYCIPVELVRSREQRKAMTVDLCSPSPVSGAVIAAPQEGWAYRGAGRLRVHDDDNTSALL